jgi:hypothetical protein
MRQSPYLDKKSMPPYSEEWRGQRKTWKEKGRERGKEREERRESRRKWVDPLPSRIVECNLSHLSELT